MGVDNHGIQWRGVVLLYTYTESVQEKKYDEEGKEMEKERKRGKKCSRTRHHCVVRIVSEPLS